jgi:hypothetical protein
MNFYARYFDQETLAHNTDELIDFLTGIQEISVTQKMVDDVVAYASSDMPYPMRYKIRPRVYFIIIKTSASSMEEFKNNRHSTSLQKESNVQPTPKDLKAMQLKEQNFGWYYGEIDFKRVIQIQETSKFQYQDTTFGAFVKAESAQQCYNLIIEHLRSRHDVDPRSQFPSAKGDNFSFMFYGDTISKELVSEKLL